MIHILTYTFSADYLAERAPHRMDHFNHLKPYIRRGELSLGGATESKTPEGVLIFTKLSKKDIVACVKSDPYVINEVVKSYCIVEWNVVVGSLIDQSIVNKK